MKTRAIYLTLLLIFGACERHSVTELSVLEKEGHESGVAAVPSPAGAQGEAPKFFPPAK